MGLALPWARHTWRQIYVSVLISLETPSSHVYFSYFICMDVTPILIALYKHQRNISMFAHTQT